MQERMERMLCVLAKKSYKEEETKKELGQMNYINHPRKTHPPGYNKYIGLD